MSKVINFNKFKKESNLIKTCDITDPCDLYVENLKKEWMFLPEFVIKKYDIEEEKRAIRQKKALIPMGYKHPTDESIVDRFKSFQSKGTEYVEENIRYFLTYEDEKLINTRDWDDFPSYDFIVNFVDVFYENEYEDYDISFPGIEPLMPLVLRFHSYFRFLNYQWKMLYHYRNTEFNKECYSVMKAIRDYIKFHAFERIYIMAPTLVDGEIERHELILKYDKVFEPESNEVLNAFLCLLFESRNNRVLITESRPERNQVITYGWKNDNGIIKVIEPEELGKDYEEYSRLEALLLFRDIEKLDEPCNEYFLTPDIL